ncbi:Protein mab-21-like [Taenia crassiceps]|uniref:Protein mab-21-like n=1 Tax=Taenia crassiceps TaxID=6207 RepID=A0ABR4Q4A7_9CEST
MSAYGPGDLASSNYRRHEEVPPGQPKYMATIFQSMKSFIHSQVEAHRNGIARNLHEVVQIAQDILREVELQEPRFINTLKTPVDSGRGGNGVSSGLAQKYGLDMDLYEGLRVTSSTEFEVILFLNQMGVFNFVDDGSVPGGAVLKLSDGRKRSMSLWVEFITASGYLSARKIRARFHSLVAQAIEKSAYRGILQLIGGANSEVKIRVRERYTLQITPAFRCQGLWPRSANHWPSTTSTGWLVWPCPRLATEVKHEGFTLLSQESAFAKSDKQQQASAEGDAWQLDFYEAEERLLSQGSRQLCLSILTTLLERHLVLNDTRMLHDYLIKTLLLHECEKHPREDEWNEYALPDRINGILLQLISCLQHRHCPHYFLPQLDLFAQHSAPMLELAARRCWTLLRSLITCPTAFQRL